MEQEAIVVAFRKHTLLPLDDCLYALQATIPQLTRSSLHRCLERHGISRLPEVEGDKPGRKKFDTYSIGFFHIDLAEVRTAEGKLYLFVAIDRTSKFAVIELVEKADMRAASTRWELFVRLSYPVQTLVGELDVKWLILLRQSLHPEPLDNPVRSRERPTRYGQAQNPNFAGDLQRDLLAPTEGHPDHNPRTREM